MNISRCNASKSFYFTVMCVCARVSVMMMKPLTRPSVLQCEVLIRESRAVDWLPSCTIVMSKIPTLCIDKHKHTRTHTRSFNQHDSYSTEHLRHHETFSKGFPKNSNLRDLKRQWKRNFVWYSLNHFHRWINPDSVNRFEKTHQLDGFRYLNYTLDLHIVWKEGRNLFQQLKRKQWESFMSMQLAFKSRKWWHGEKKKNTERAKRMVLETHLASVTWKTITLAWTHRNITTWGQKQSHRYNSNHKHKKT